MRYLLFVFFLFAGCSSRIHEQMINDYAIGNFSVVEEKITQRIENERKDVVLLYLNRGMTRLANEDSKGALQDFKYALEAIDFYNQELFADLAGQLLFDDANAPYKGDDFEQTLARLYFALSLLANNDENNACAILQQSEEADQKKRFAYSRHQVYENFVLNENLIQKALFSYLLAKRGDSSNANLLKSQIENTSALKIPTYVSNKSFVIVLCHNGLAPCKISSICPASIASAYVLEMILGAQGFDPTVCTAIGIQVPELCTPLSHCPLPVTIRIGDHKEQLQTVCDVGYMAEQELRQKMPIIAAKAAARILLRRSIVGCVQEQDARAGALVDLGMLVANACTKADTRSWGTLPMSIDASFLQMNPGIHQIDIEVSLYDYCYSKSMHTIKVQEGDICIINVFNLHPGITKVIIPNKFKVKESLCIE